MKTMMLSISLFAAAALAAGCGGNNQTEAETPEPADEPALAEDDEEAPAGPATANAVLESRSGSDVTGMVTFTEVDGGVQVGGEISGLEPGQHGFHVHETGDCSAEDASSAGGHFNPTGASHGGPTAPEHHVGDMGNITASDEGVAQVDELFEFLTLEEGAPTSIAGRAVVVHGGADDLESQPSGAAGARVACGVIELDQ